MNNKNKLSKGIESINNTGTRIQESEGRLGTTGKVAKYAMAPSIYATKKALGIAEFADQTVSKGQSWVIDKVGLTNFFKSEFYFFIKQYLYFFILLTICFYIIIYLSNSSNPTTKSEAKVFFY